MAAEETKECATQATGFMSLGVTDAVVVQHKDGFWRQGHVVSCVDTYTVMYEDGSHSTLDDKRFVVQALSRVTEPAVGYDVMVAVNEAQNQYKRGVVLSGTDSVDVVVGEPGVDWAWIHGSGDITAPHIDGSTAVLQVRNPDAIMTVPRTSLRSGLHWLVLMGKGLEGVYMDPATLFHEQAGDAPGHAAEDDMGAFRWAVDGSRGGAQSYTPMYGASHILQAIATRFDLDGDGALNLDEYNAFQRACLGCGASQDTTTEEAIESAKIARKSNLSSRGFKNMASASGVQLVNGAVLLSAVPQLWQQAAARRAKTPPKRYPGPQGVLGRFCWEVCNTLVLRLGFMLRSRHIMGLLEGSSTATPSDKIAKFMATLPKLLAAAGTAAAIAVYDTVSALIKKAIARGEELAPQVVEMLQQAIAFAIESFPHVVALFAEAFHTMVLAAPKVFAEIKKVWPHIIDGAKRSLVASGKLVHATMLMGMNWAGHFNAACAEAIAMGAPIARDVMVNSWSLICAGLAAAPEHAALTAEYAAAIYSESKAQISVAVNKTLEFIKYYVLSDTMLALARESVDAAKVALETGPAWFVHTTKIFAENSMVIADAARELDDITIEGGKYAYEEMRRFFHFCKDNLIPVADEMKDVTLECIRNGQELAPHIREQVTGMMEQGFKVATTGICAGVMCAVTWIAENAPTMEEMQEATAYAIAEVGGAVRILGNSEAVRALGGLAEANRVVSLALIHQMKKAMADGAEISEAALLQLKALSQEALHASRVVSKETAYYAMLAGEAASEQAKEAAKMAMYTAKLVAAESKASSMAALAALDDAFMEQMEQTRILAGKAKVAFTELAVISGEATQDMLEVAKAATESAIAEAAPAARQAAELSWEAACQSSEAIKQAAHTVGGLVAAGNAAGAVLIASGATAVATVLKDAFSALAQWCSEDGLILVQRTLAASVNVGLAVFDQLSKSMTEFYHSAIEAGRALEPAARIIASAGQQMSEATLSAGAAAAQALNEGAIAAAEGMQPALETIGAALREGAEEYKQLTGIANEQIADGLATAGRAIADVGQDAFKLAVEQGKPFFDAAVAHAGNFAEWAQIDEAYNVSQELLAQTYEVAGDAAVGCWACCTGCIGSIIDSVKSDIIRDFFQNIGLFFSSITSKTLAEATKMWGILANLVALDFNFVFPSISPVVIYVAIGLVALILIICFIVFMCLASYMQHDAIRQGHEAENWQVKAKKYKKRVMFLKFFLTGCMGVYLPVSRTIFQVIMCEDTLRQFLIDDIGIPDCKSWDQYFILQIVAGVLMLSFTIALPVMCAWLIKRNKPIGSRDDATKRYNEHGDLVDFTTQMYNQDLNTDPRQKACPYLFLYKGYERPWAFYKVWIMFVKFLLCIPIIVWYDSPVIQTSVSLGLLAIFAAFSWYSTPFINPHADAMDGSARVTALTTLLLAFLGSESLFPSAGNIWSTLLNIVNFVNLLLIIFFTLMGFKCFRLRIQSCSGKLAFKDTVANVNGPAKKVVPDWDIRKELTARIWHNFWHSFMANKCSQQVAQRLRELLHITSDVGLKNIVAHFEAVRRNPERLQQRQWVLDNLEGVDVYFDGPVHDGHQDSATKFGKMYVKPYPFECVMVYDDSSDYTFIREDHFDMFFAQNTSADVQERRHNRQCVRALNGQSCYWPHQQWENRTLPDGTESYTDSEGNQRTKTHYSTVRVLMSYTNGRMSVGAKGSKPFAAGFKVSLSFSDGTGTAHLPRTGRDTHVTGSHSMGPSEFGLDNTFRTTDTLRDFFNKNGPAIQQFLPSVRQAAANYRQGLQEKRMQKERILSSGFWLQVYNNFNAPREQIETYLRTQELNDDLRTIPAAHSAGLDFLYQRVAYVTAHPCCGLWWLFFQDLWDNNGSLAVFKDHAEVLDPRNSTSIAYSPIKRPDLEKRLEEMGVRGVGGCCGAKYMTDEVLDALYNRMEAEETAWRMRRGGAQA